MGYVSVIGHADRAGPLRDYCTGLVMPCERAVRGLAMRRLERLENIPHVRCSGHTHGPGCGHEAVPHGVDDARAVVPYPDLSKAVLDGSLSLSDAICST